MKIERYLIVGKQRHRKPTARLSIKAPSMESHEVAVKLSLDLPDALFTKPQLQASFKVPEEAVSPPVIESHVIDNIKASISK